MQTKTATHITAISTVGVPTTDQERALAFYVDELGFEKRRDLTFGEGNRWIEVGLPGAPTTISLLPIPEGQPVGIDTQVRLTTEDADADYAALRERGVEVGDQVLRWGGGVPPMFTFRDPDGNTLYVVEAAPGR